MLTYDDLHLQNHKITELTNILNHLLGDRSLCDSEVTCELFFRYVDAVKEHFEVTDSSLYSRLLTHGEQRARNTAQRFIGGSKEIKRIFAHYLKRWCSLKKKQLVIKEYEQFRKETDEMFDMVLERLQSETEHLYPLIREVTGDERQVA
jgi:hypothetical protein